jgi:hypothetical protein
MFATESRLPHGILDAMFPFKIRNITHSVVYHLRAVDQFRGFPASAGTKSKKPSLFRYGVYRSMQY